MFRRHGGWAFRVDAGFHPEAGKRRQVLRQGFTTKKQAEAALAAAHQAAASNTVVAKSSVRLGEYLVEWLAGQRGRLRPTTMHSYEVARLRIDRVLGPMALQSITPLQIERFYADMLEGGGSGGTPLAAKTCATCTLCCARRWPTPNASASSLATQRPQLALQSPAGQSSRRGRQTT